MTKSNLGEEKVCFGFSWPSGIHADRQTLYKSNLIWYGRQFFDVALNESIITLSVTSAAKDQKQEDEEFKVNANTANSYFKDQIIYQLSKQSHYFIHNQCMAWRSQLVLTEATKKATAKELQRSNCKWGPWLPSPWVSHRMWSLLCQRLNPHDSMWVL